MRSQDVSEKEMSGFAWVVHIAADPQHVSGLLTAAKNTYFTSGQEHTVKRIAQFHLSFEHIHPFVDGNGRIGRVLNNFLLIRDRHIPINIKFLDRARYTMPLRSLIPKGK